MFNFLNTLSLAFESYWQSFVKKIPILLLALAIFLIFWIIARIEKAITLRVIKKLKDKEKVELTILFDRLTRIGVLIFGTIFALSIAGVNLAALITGLGLVGFVLSFALQDYIKNFLAGIIILTQKPFIIGDQIEIGQFSGKVSAIEMRFTILKAFDGREILISNADILSKAIIRTTAYPIKQSKIEIILEYKKNLRDLMKLIARAIKDTEGVQAQPEPKVLIVGMEDKKIKLNFFYWAGSSKENELSVKSLVIENICKVLEKEMLGKNVKIK